MCPTPTIQVLAALADDAAAAVSNRVAMGRTGGRLTSSMTTKPGSTTPQYRSRDKRQLALKLEGGRAYRVQPDPIDSGVWTGRFNSRQTEREYMYAQLNRRGVEVRRSEEQCFTEFRWGDRFVAITDQEMENHRDRRLDFILDVLHYSTRQQQWREYMNRDLPDIDDGGPMTAMQTQQRARLAMQYGASQQTVDRVTREDIQRAMTLLARR